MTADRITITLPDGSQREVEAGTTIRQLAESIGRRLGKDAIGGIVDDSAVIDVHTPLTKPCKVRIVTVKTAEGLEVLRHSTAHLMASAVQRLYPGTQVTIGPAIATGFYYDFERKGGFTPDDLHAIEAEMRRIATLDLPFAREEVTREQAHKLFTELGETFKLEILAAIPAGEVISLYRHGDWVDLCRGPHLPSTGYIKAFKLTHVAGAFWRGDENNPMLTRIYGTAFWEQKELDAHFAALEEAKKRDHRRLGKDLDLFSFHPVAPAMPFFHPNGALIYNLLVDLVRKYYAHLGFQEVITPQVFDSDLFRTSGHYDHYHENMFFSHIDEREFGFKPMNCPSHTLIYSSQKRSYRDLPIRLADFGRLHRYERSGVTAGLTRVRSFCQDDAHIFCREDQIGAEIEKQLLMIQDMYSHFGFSSRVGVSTRSASSLGREPGLSEAQRQEWDAIWARAEKQLFEAIERAKLPHHVNVGDGAFYGPKIDVEVEDALGRKHQLGTIQLDYGLPKRFGLAYTNAESRESRPVMIHRAVLGSLERFIGILIEHCAGDFPLWLAPTQARVIAVNDDLLGYGREVAEAFDKRGLRVKIDERSEKLGFKIRDAELNKVPVVLVVGQKEKDARSVSLRWRKKGDLGLLSLDQAIETVLDAAAVPGPGEVLLSRVERTLGLT